MPTPGAGSRSHAGGLVAAADALLGSLTSVAEDLDHGRRPRLWMRRSACLVSIERRSQCVDLASVEVLHHGDAAHVEAVVGAFDHLQFAGHAGLLEPSGVLDVLVVEQVDGSDPDPGRRQTRKILRTRWCSVGVYVAIRGAGQVRGPAEAVAGLVPPLDRHVIQVCSPGGAIVEHRVDQQLEGRFDVHLVSSSESQSCGQATACARTADGDAQLMALAGCTASDIISIMGKKQQHVTSLEINVHGDRVDCHPRIYEKLYVEYVIGGIELDPKAVERSVQLSVEKYCSVQAMLSVAVPIEHKITIL